VHSQNGPSRTALVAVLSGVSQRARREVSRLCGELFGVPVSVGSVQKLCERMSDAVAAPVEALAAAVRQQPVVGMDETSWRVQHKRRYLWVVWSPIGSIYKIGTRAAKVDQSLSAWPSPAAS
jgi:transposase